jgi:hypothetical protein
MISEGGSGQQDHEEELLTAEQVQIGGTYDATLNTSLHWGEGGWPEVGAPFEDIENSLTARIRGSLFFDARPEENFRVFGKVKSAYPFYRPIAPAAADPSDPASSHSHATRIPDLTVFELYADTNWDDRLFIRAGKQVAMWGVGYFFSPADFLSLSLIDPEEPEAEREGPAAVKLTYPIGINTLYFHLVAPPDLAAMAAGGTAPDMGDLAYAPKAELVLGNFELGIGGYWSRGQAPRGMLTATGALGLIDLFAEGVVSWGSDRNYVEPASDSGTPAAPPYTVYTREEEAIVSATAGMRVIDEAADLTLAAQYYYNGEGYEGIESTAHRDALFAAAAAGDISSADLQRTGRHYAAATAGWSGAMGGDLTFSLLWQGNLSDGSGAAAPQIGWRLLEHVQLLGGVKVHYGPEYGEYYYRSRPLSLTLECTVHGSF